MSQTNLLIDTLKQELRKQRINYRQVAEALDLSEASVKRLFAERNFSIERLEKICLLLKIGFSELVQQMEKNIALTTELTLDQEKELVSDIKLLLMAHFLVNRYQFDEIIKLYQIGESEGIKLLARLDRMKIIELQPGNRVKLLISPNFKWIAEGPIQRFFEEKVQSEFFNSSFTGNDEIRFFSSGSITREASAEIISKIRQLAREINSMIKDSESLPPEQRIGHSLLVAMRPWEVKVFRDLRRADADRHVPG